ncbi:MAG TPA: ComEA family DNA-binding protein [Phycisphaerales bacterium]|nr:ComEA family DNA-binding protein [Phycisphaerales bacterium]
MNAARTSRDRLPGGALMLALLAVFVVVMAAMRIDRPFHRDLSALAVAAWPDMRINLNTATEAELQLLPGIGAALAMRIVEDRQERGAYQSVDDLQRVRGVGPVVLQRLREYVVVDEADVQRD